MYIPTVGINSLTNEGTVFSILLLLQTVSQGIFCYVFLQTCSEIINIILGESRWVRGYEHLNTTRWCQIILQNHAAKVHFYQQCLRVSASPHSPWLVRMSVLIPFLSFSFLFLVFLSQCFFVLLSSFPVSFHPSFLPHSLLPLSLPFSSFLSFNIW